MQKYISLQPKENMRFMIVDLSQLVPFLVNDLMRIVRWFYVYDSINKSDKGAKRDEKELVDAHFSRLFVWPVHTVIDFAIKTVYKVNIERKCVKSRSSICQSIAKESINAIDNYYFDWSIEELCLVGHFDSILHSRFKRQS